MARRGSTEASSRASSGIRGPGISTVAQVRTLASGQSWLPIRVIGSPTAVASPEAPRASASRDGWWPAVLTIALGGLVVSLGYAAGRSHDDGASALYWLGQALIWLPAAGWLLSPRTDTRTRIAILLAIAGAQALSTWAYSPDQFRFTDEFQHVRTLDDILRTHHLFSANSFLPESPPFPGLEIVTQSLMSLTGLSSFTSGVIVDTVTHGLLPLFVFLGYRELVNDDRTASVAAFLYLTAPHLGYLEVLFIYSTPALLYFAIAFRTMLRIARGRNHVATILLPFVPMLLCHHLTTFAGLVMLMAMVVILAAAGSRRAAGRLLGATAAITAGVIAWVVVLAPETFGYLAAPLTTAVQTFTHPAHAAATTPTSSVGAPPHWETLVATLGALLLFVASVAGALTTLWSHAGRVASLVSLLGFVYPLVLVVRLVVPDGATLAARLLTYTMLFIAFPAAVALIALWDRHAPRLRKPLIWSVAGVLALTGLLTGLPPSYERIPGRFLVAGFESGIDERIAYVGHWANTWSPNSRVICDVSACDTIGGYSRATISTAGSQIYYAPTVNALNEAIADQAINYVETDVRWTRQIPLSGAYWTSDTHVHTHPLPVAILRRINRDPYVDLVYDDGLVRVYDTTLVFHS